MHVRIPRPLDIKHPVLPRPLPRQRHLAILPLHPPLHPMRNHHLHLLPHPIQDLIRQHARRRVLQLLRLLRPTLRLLLVIRIHVLVLTQLVAHISLINTVTTVTVITALSAALSAAGTTRTTRTTRSPPRLRLGHLFRHPLLSNLETNAIRHRNPPRRIKRRMQLHRQRVIRLQQHV